MKLNDRPTKKKLQIPQDRMADNSIMQMYSPKAMLTDVISANFWIMVTMNWDMIAIKLFEKIYIPGTLKFYI